MNESFGKKFPGAHAKTNACAAYMAEVWEETFPQHKSEAHKKMEKRKERARFVKELEAKAEAMTPEELEAYMESIPEWKRGALVISEQQEDKEVEGLFKRIRGKIGGKVKSTDAYKNY